MINWLAHIDRELLTKIASGDEAAFARFFREVTPGLQAFAWKMLRSDEAVKEVIQETFIRVWIHRDQLPGLDQPVHWLFRVASNECFTWLNKQAIRRRSMDQMNPAITLSSNMGEENLAKQETLALIREAVGKLPPKRKRIYLMSRAEGFKTNEIADSLNLSHSYVKNALTASLQFIREYLVSAGKIMLMFCFSSPF